MGLVAGLIIQMNSGQNKQWASRHARTPIARQ